MTFTFYTNFHSRYLMLQNIICDNTIFFTVHCLPPAQKMEVSGCGDKFLIERMTVKCLKVSWRDSLIKGNMTD